MGRYEFNRESRLVTPGHFKQVFDNPSRFGSKHFTVLITTNTSDKPRLGMAIAKKRVKLAVGRNRIKRIVRESFRQNQHNLPAVDLVVMVKSGIDQLDNALINQQLENIWRKIKQRHKSS
ncbi:ribonuclease P protein component [Thalassotalea ponticola]|uniref:ribonuclease P protein component n=1 Tax=Thalassotalea ponticola TaxID=1523392 RepID=UPI0025B45124|nr:ribonuclease P protein component [Thalassotalea ponticola]MDN3653065.1 ribonuclease P protein component [Thalassotalea ponticola]